MEEERYMINFTVGPVQSNEEVCEIGAHSAPYFRTPEFSEIMLENERLMNKFAGAPEGSRTVFLTGSGTAAMEAAVINLLTKEDNVLVVKGGTFGERFCKLCEIHGVPYKPVNVTPGHGLTEEDLRLYDRVADDKSNTRNNADEGTEDQDFTALLVNIHETSTGVLYDIDLISDFCRRNGLFLIVDAISSFLADPIDMSRSGIDVMITGSQKALAVPPGVSMLVMSPRALERVERIDSGCMYLDIKDALKNGERGQTPFTPAVTTLLQINARLRQIDKDGGPGSEIGRVRELADDFRHRIQDMPFEIFSEAPSKAVTSILTTKISAKWIFTTLKDEYGIWICPNGGDMAETVFRVGHIGNLTVDDNMRLIEAFEDIIERWESSQWSE